MRTNSRLRSYTFWPTTTTKDFIRSGRWRKVMLASAAFWVASAWFADRW